MMQNDRPAAIQAAVDELALAAHVNEAHSLALAAVLETTWRMAEALDQLGHGDTQRFCAGLFCSERTARYCAEIGRTVVPICRPHGGPWPFWLALTPIT